MQLVGINRINRLGVARQQWSPASILGGPYAAFDPYQANSLQLSGGAVATWSSLVNGLAPAQALGASRPVFGFSPFNSQQIVTPDGVDDQLTHTGIPAGFPTGATPFEIWVIWNQTKLVADTGDRCAIAWGGGGNNFHCGVYRGVVSGVNRARLFVGTGTATALAHNTVVDFSGRHVVRAVVDGTSIRVDVDGVAGTPVAAVPNIGNTLLRLFCHSINTVSFGAGDFSGIWVTPLTSARDAAFMYDYCNRRIVV